MQEHLLLLFIIGHLLSDFYFQNDDMAMAKDPIVLLKHCLIYTLIQLVMILPVFTWSLAGFSILISLLHGLIEYQKIKRYQIGQQSNGFKHLAVDQILHLVTIYLLTVIASYTIGPVLYTPIFQNIINFIDIDMSYLLKWLTAILLIIQPSSIMIRIILDGYKINDKQFEGENSVPNAGALIGVLERLILIILINTNQYTAIGFILTAKSIARYNKITESQQFAEYYLLGTLLSALLVFVTYSLLF